MNRTLHDVAAPRILAVDDERQILASLRLRLQDAYELVSCTDPGSGLASIQQEQFDLCIVDLHMPGMDGIAFIEAARLADPGLGFVVLSGYGTDENLRRTIPLQVYDFVSKPMTDRAAFELRLPDWVQRTRQRRQELALVKDSASLARELGAAQLERDIEFTASESARDALLQTANLLTTVHALLVSIAQTVDGRGNRDPGMSTLARPIHEARKAAEAASSVTEGFFNSAYANRDASPAHLSGCLQHAISICMRWTHADEHRKAIDFLNRENSAIIRDLSGIDLLLLLVSAVGAALEIAEPGSTVQVRTEEFQRLGTVQSSLATRDFLWVNRKQLPHGSPGILLGLKASGPALSTAEVKRWLEGNANSRIKSPVRGLLHGLQKSKGMMGFSVLPSHERFQIVVALPT